MLCLNIPRSRLVQNMRILFLHQNFPAQFVHVAQALQQRGHDLHALTDATNKRPELIPTSRYAFEARAAGQPHPLAQNYALRAARGNAAARAMVVLRDSGFVPDLVIGHLGWGETLFVKDVFPEARLIVHAEFYYSADGADAGFDPEFRTGDDVAWRQNLRSKNVAILQAVNDADFALSPTLWQASRLPAAFRSKTTVLHEGIDTDKVAPNPNARLTLQKAGVAMKPGDEIITFVNRNLEPYRGYHMFLRALPKILRARPKARAVIVGGHEVSYGAAPPPGKSWKQIFLDEVQADLPMDRVHFTGKVPYPDYLRLMQISAAHVYLTYPFVLSWSMLEAMSAGALVIASATPPVTEVIRHGDNGLLFDFFDTGVLAAQVIEALALPSSMRAIRARARKTIVERYDLKRICLPQWLDFVERAAGIGPPADASMLQATIH